MTVTFTIEHLCTQQGLKSQFTQVSVLQFILSVVVDVVRVTVSVVGRVLS